MLKHSEITSKAEIRQMVAFANEYKVTWKATALKYRTGLSHKIEKIFFDNRQQIRDCIVQEIGTPINECQAAIDSAFVYWDWFNKNVEAAIQPHVIARTTIELHKMIYEPLGSVAVITSWNLPFNLFVWGVIPNLLVGNTVIYKPSTICPKTNRFFNNLINRASLPKGLLQIVYGSGKQGSQLLQQDINAIWFTGSSSVGRQIYQQAGQKMIPVIAELGGSNPAIVFPDANINLAVSGIMAKRFNFAGQTCDGVKRLIIHKNIADEFLNKMAEKIKTIKVGKPSDCTTSMGPLVSQQQHQLLVDQVNDAMQHGAKLFVKGSKPLFGKNYYAPTVLVNINQSMRVWKEEVFGPVLPVMFFQTEKEAINLANNSIYGLGAQIYTKDPVNITKLIQTLEVCNIEVNGASHLLPCNPFGGYKQSGIGREHGIKGMQELCQIKVISQSRLV